MTHSAPSESTFSINNQLHYSYSVELLHIFSSATCSSPPLTLHLSLCQCKSSATFPDGKLIMLPEGNKGPNKECKASQLFMTFQRLFFTAGVGHLLCIHDFLLWAVPEVGKLDNWREHLQLRIMTQTKEHRSKEGTRTRGMMIHVAASQLTCNSRDNNG